jgi:hypothetical protein
VVAGLEGDRSRPSMLRHSGKRKKPGAVQGMVTDSTVSASRELAA